MYINICEVNFSLSVSFPAPSTSSLGLKDNICYSIYFSGSVLFLPSVWRWQREALRVPPISLPCQIKSNPVVGIYLMLGIRQTNLRKDCSLLPLSFIFYVFIY